MSRYPITEIDDRNQLYEFLRRDVGYNAYALADLASPFWEKTQWYAALEEEQIAALAMVYAGLDPPILFLAGEQDTLGGLLLGDYVPNECVLVAPKHMHSPLERYFRVVSTYPMYRLRVTEATFRRRYSLATYINLIELGVSDLNAMEKLIMSASQADQRDLRDVAFSPRMLSDGYYRGITIDESLVAIAGTHLATHNPSVAAVGNVVVHQSHRNRGLGGVICQTVVEALLKNRFDLIVLNVREDNHAANVLYTRLGFFRVASYIEGFATRR